MPPFFRANVLCLASATANLGEKQIDTKWGVLVIEVALELVDLLLEHLGGVADAADDTKTARVGDGSGELGASGDVHAGEQDGVLDPEQVGDGRANLLCEDGPAVSIMTLVAIGMV
jgi:hypothetical protein